MHIKELLDRGLSLEQIQSEIEKEYQTYHKQKHIDEARAKAVNAVAEYVALMDPSINGDEVNLFIRSLTNGFLDIEKSVEPSHKPIKVKPRVRRLSEEEAARVLEDFFKGLD